MPNLNQTPTGERVTIGLFGRRNAGKSALINALTGQSLAIVSDVAGTTTDPVSKAMELLPLGPVTVIDTPGLDDEGELGRMRVERTYGVLNRTDIAVIVIDATRGMSEWEEKLLALIREKEIPHVIAWNQSDREGAAPPVEGAIAVSALRGDGIEELRGAIASFTDNGKVRRIISDLVQSNDIVVLVTLLACEDEEIINEMYALAEQIKKDFYGNRIVMFAPLYLSNYCVNGCVYCPYHHQNKCIARKKLTQDEIRREVIALQDMGHKRLALEAGEDPVNNPIEYILESIKTIYDIKHKNGAIRRVNVNIAATTVENYRKLKDAGIGTYILFQETYHKESYEKLHPTGPKHNYAYHTEAMDRAMEGGIDDVGLGVLYGLELYRYEFAALLMHAEHLEAVHGVGPHTISMPRIKKAQDIDPNAFDNSISDDIFAKLCALIRISVPYTGMIISTRESKEVRARLLKLGVSQISGASKTSVGGYADDVQDEEDTAQFDVSDNRTLDEVVNWLIRLGYIPSFCTACYREGRTGDRFMSLCKSGQIGNCCQPNALMTLKEYLMDYASLDTRVVGTDLILKEINNIPNPKVRSIVIQRLKDIRNGQRDFRF